MKVAAQQSRQTVYCRRIFVVLLLCAPILSGQSLQVAMVQVIPSNALPGIPPALEITLNNAGGEPVTLSAVALSVERKGGIVFQPRWGLRDGLLAPVSEEETNRTTVPSGGKHTVVIAPNASFLGNNWFFDDRLCVPGVFLLRAAIHYETVRGEAKQAIGAPVSYEVVEPSGVDAEVWAFLRSKSATGTWTVRDWEAQLIGVSTTIWERYPNSGYIPWVAPVARFSSPEDRIVAIKRVAAALGTDPLGERLFLYAAYLDGDQADKLRATGDLQSGLRHYDDARQGFANLSESHYEHIRKEAKRALNQMQARAEFERRQE